MQPCRPRSGTRPSTAACAFSPAEGKGAASRRGGACDVRWRAAAARQSPSPRPHHTCQQAKGPQCTRGAQLRRAHAVGTRAARTLMLSTSYRVIACATNLLAISSPSTREAAKSRVFATASCFVAAGSPAPVHTRPSAKQGIPSAAPSRWQ
eukprot:7382218-Prymnesium_polylepis.1